MVLPVHSTLTPSHCVGAWVQLAQEAEAVAEAAPETAVEVLLRSGLSAPRLPLRTRTYPPVADYVLAEYVRVKTLTASLLWPGCVVWAKSSLLSSWMSL